MPEERAATVRSLAKINVDLRVLYKRPDNYHELRTIFQTISLADTIRIRFTRARRSRLRIEGNADIPDNLILRAARAVLDDLRIAADIVFDLDKRIPMGAGLGGGSSNAAAILLALPVLAGVEIPLARLVEIGAGLGSDVPFFLHGGTALGIGRGTELYPSPDLAARGGVLIAPDIHVSTAEAYQGLKRTALTTPGRDNDTETFQSLVWALGEPGPSEDWKMLCTNHFERAVFPRHPMLRAMKRRLETLGGRPSLMTGSGSALFGLFDAREADSAYKALCEDPPGHARIFKIALISRRRYRNLWRRQLAEHISTETLWPPRSRYSKQ